MKIAGPFEAQSITLLSQGITQIFPPNSSVPSLVGNVTTGRYVSHNPCFYGEFIFTRTNAYRVEDKLVGIGTMIVNIISKDSIIKIAVTYNVRANGETGAVEKAEGIITGALKNGCPQTGTICFDELGNFRTQVTINLKSIS